MNTRNATEFFWVGNHPGIDLVNTEAVDADGVRLELVPDWTALIDWAQAADLIDADLAGQCRVSGEMRQRSLLAWFRRLRSSLRNVLETGDDETAAGALDGAVAAVSVRLSYRPTRDQLGLPLDAPGPLEQLRLALASTALDATSLERSRVRFCGDPRCVLLYYDTTKNRSRRWCDMAVCGNRAKVSAHYERAKREPTAHRHQTT
jgi:predicted RNA-binding Zn ribbon-like protein